MHNKFERVLEILMNRRSFLQRLIGCGVAAGGLLTPQVASAIKVSRFFCGSADVYEDVTLWWRCEGTTLDHPANDYSAGDTTATLYNAATINTDAVMVGTNGLDIPGADDHAYFAVSSSDIIDVSIGRIGFYFKYTTWVNNTPVIDVRLDGSNYFSLEIQSEDGLKLYWTDGGTARTALTIDNAGLSSPGVAYFIEMAWDTSANYREVFVDGVSQGSDSSSTIGSFAATELNIGESYSGNAVDYHIDNVMVSNSKSRDFNILKNETSYPG